MSYCVNCGVELKSGDHCPLCQTPVLNPAHSQPPPNDAYPLPGYELPATLHNRLIAVMMSLCMALPAAVTIVADAVFSEQLSWSLIVLCSLSFIWVLTAVPLLLKKPDFFTLLFINGAALLLFLYFISALTGSTVWFFELAMPIVGVLIALLFVIWLLAHLKILKGLSITSVCTACCGIFALCVELFVNGFLGQEHLVWSWFAVTPCAAFTIFFAYVEHNKALKQELRKRFHV